MFQVQFQLENSFFFHLGSNFESNTLMLDVQAMHNQHAVLNDFAIDILFFLNQNQ